MILTSNVGVHKSNVVIHRGCFPVLWEASIFIFTKKNRPATVIFGESLQVCDFVLFLSRMCSFVLKHKIGINNTDSSNSLSSFSLNHRYSLPQSDRVRLNRQALRCQEGAEGHRELLNVHEQLQQIRQSYP